MIKLKMTKDKGSPWKIPIWRGNELVVQELVATTAERLVVHDQSDKNCGKMVMFKSQID